jgi:hypothetical protein
LYVRASPRSTRMGDDEWFRYTPDPSKQSYVWIRLEKGVANEDRGMALVQAVEEGDLTTIKALKSEGVRARLPAGRTLLMLRPPANIDGVVSALGARGAKPNNHARFGWAALMPAKRGSTALSPMSSSLTARSQRGPSRCQHSHRCPKNGDSPPRISKPFRLRGLGR